MDIVGVARRRKSKLSEIVTNRRPSGRALGNSAIDIGTAAFGSYPFRIMATSDVHAHLMPYDYTWDQPLDSAGLVRTASLIRTARAEVANSILVDNGDFLQGSPLGDLASHNGHLSGGVLHPVIAAMNAAGYDIATLGNHEFSYGIEFLEAALAGAAFPTICANAVTELGKCAALDQHFCPPFAILDRILTRPDGKTMSLRIGLIGFLPPQVEIWENKHLAGKIATRDILDAAQTWVPRLRAAGADLVVALCHSGLGAAEPYPRMENAAIPLAGIAGIDAVVAGHTHLVLPSATAGNWPHVDAVTGSIHGKPAVMAGFWGSHLAIIDLDLTYGDTGWSVSGFSCSTRAIAERNGTGRLQGMTLNDPAVETAASGGHHATLRYIRTPVGSCDVPMHSYFARLADSAALGLVHAAQSDWLASAVRGTIHDGLPILSAASPFKSGGRGGPQFFTDIPAGGIAQKHIADLYTFPNSIRALCITGATLKDWLERSAAQFHQLQPGITNQPLINPESPSYNFDAIAGVSYEIDLAAKSRFSINGALLDPDATRICNLQHKGRPVDPKARFLIATNNFRASGGGAFPGLDSQSAILEPLTLTTEILRAYIARIGHISPQVTHHWRLIMNAGNTAAWFDTGPHAWQHLPQEGGLDIRVLGDTAEGFLRCELRF